MDHPVTGEKLVIRECFDRWRLVEDEETEEEHKMRKVLLNKFKRFSKHKGTTFHQSVAYEMTDNGIVTKGVTYIKEKT